MLIKGPREERIQQKFIVECLSHHSSDEFKEVKVVLINARIRTWLESDSVRSRNEQCVVGVEDLLRERQKPLASQTADIHSLLPLEFDFQLPFHLRRLVPLQLLVGIQENLISPDSQSHRGRIGIMRLLYFLQLRFKVSALVLEIQNLGHLLYHFQEDVIYQRHVLFYHVIYQNFVVFPHKSKHVLHF